MPTSPGSSSRPLRTSATAARAAWALGAASALLLTLVVTRWGPLLAVDEAVARATHRWAVGAPGPTSAARILSDWVWDPWTMRLICAVVVVWSLLRWRDRRLAAWLTVACVLGSLAQLGLKAAVGRARPVWTDPVDSAEFAAFPSGHAMTATFVCGLLLRVLRRRGARPGVRRAALAVASVSVVGVGLTRVWLGVHWASDVVAGWSFGALVVAVAVLVDRRRAIRPG
ncbi:phosphatase PAP2 family protein [Streptomyces sp. ZYX-F-203]